PGVDVSPGPVALMSKRLERLGATKSRAQQGSAHALPFGDRTFDFVYSIGCLHHTGDLSRAVNEAGRVLRPGGTAVVMVYNRQSFRNLSRLPRRIVRRLIRGAEAMAEEDRA